MYLWKWERSPSALSALFSSDWGYTTHPNLSVQIYHYIHHQYYHYHYRFNSKIHHHQCTLHHQYTHSSYLRRLDNIQQHHSDLRRHETIHDKRKCRRGVCQSQLGGDYSYPRRKRVGRFPCILSPVGAFQFRSIRLSRRIDTASLDPALPA